MEYPSVVIVVVAVRCRHFLCSLQVAAALSKLADPELYAKKYGLASVPDATNLLVYAMGDGNHSFATAKLHWEKTKAAAQVHFETCRAQCPRQEKAFEVGNITFFLSGTCVV